MSLIVPNCAKVLPLRAALQQGSASRRRHIYHAAQTGALLTVSAQL